MKFILSFVRCVCAVQREKVGLHEIIPVNPVKNHGALGTSVTWTLSTLVIWLLRHCRGETFFNRPEVAPDSSPEDGATELHKVQCQTEATILTRKSVVSRIGRGSGRAGRAGQ